MNGKIKVVCIVGPTASGKTALSVSLARHFDGEIVGADSMQIYKGMSIASAAPSKDERMGIAHHLIEFADPSLPFTVADYTLLAKNAVADIADRNKLPIIVGGTGLYINSLIDNIRFAEHDDESAEKVRKKLFGELEDLGAEALLERLRAIDPVSAQRLHKNNTRRIVRALEVYELTGMTLTEQNALSKSEQSPYDPLMIGITYKDRDILYERINRRVDVMLENGLLKEAQTAYEARHSGDTSLQAIGHKEFFPYFEGEKSLDEAVEDLKRATRRYAKRQLTWFNRDERINWIYADCTADVYAEAAAITQNFLKEEKP